MTFSKEDFVDAINRLKAANNLQDDIDNLMEHARENIENDFMNACALMINHEALVVKLLEVIMDDQDENISYFIYELQYGAEYEPGCYTINGKEVDISTPENLYDYLISEKERRDAEVRESNN